MMTDADGLLAARFAATRDSHDDSDWNDVLERLDRESTPTRRSRRPALLVAALLLAIAVPTLAFSATVRDFIGLGGPRPDYARARLAVSAPIPGGRIAHLWVSPSRDGGECQFVTFDRAGMVKRPTRMDGGGSCASGQEPFRGRLTWQFSSGSTREPPIFHGRVGQNVNAARVELRWRKGSQELSYKKGFFIAASPALVDPPFPRLPYDVVLLNRAGKVVARSRIPTSFLYRDWKRVEPRLRDYRVAHGCDKVAVWRCKSR